jgi:pimeloyl-ACP methyl ester carboxylesterase
MKFKPYSQHAFELSYQSTGGPSVLEPESRPVPVVLCLHGNRDSSKVFAPMIGNLSSTCLVVSLDLRGHGDSDVPDQPFSIDDMVADIRLLLDHLELTSVSLLGHSLGASLSLLFSSRYPERVEKLVLMGAAPRFKPPFKRPAAGETITPQMVEETNRGAAAYFFTPNHPDVQQQILAGWKQMPPQMHQLMIKVKHPELFSLLHIIRQPVLLVCGGDDKITPLEASLELNRELPDSRLLVVPGSGHFVFLEEEPKVTPHVAVFVRGNK